jgi:two-component system sensor histidine kinase BaeS
VKKGAGLLVLLTIQTCQPPRGKPAQPLSVAIIAVLLLNWRFSLQKAILRFPIGHRLFVAVLLAILAVAATGIALMRQNVLRSFSEYAANIELDRLEGLSAALARRYDTAGGWRFLPTGPGARRAWVAAELARLQSEGPGQPAPPAPMRPPAPPQPPAAPAPAAIRTVVPAQAGTQVRSPAGALSDTARLNTMAPLPPLPPLPAPPVPPTPPVPAAEAVELDELALQDRITLLDAAGRYLAGRVPGLEASARRPIESGDQVVGYLAVARVMRPSDALAAAFLGELRNSLLGIVAASVALSALAAVLLAAHFRKPIGRLAIGARALAEGRFETRLPTSRSDELGELAHSFNQLAQRLGGLEQSRRQWVADTSHELRTPLSVLRAQLEAIQDGVRTPDAGTVASMLRQVLSLNALIDQLYALARADVGALECHRELLDLWALARECAAAFEDKLRAAGLTLETGPAPASGVVEADPERMRQVFTNLLENAVRYTGAGGRVALSADAAGDRLAIIIEDSAPGVPDEALARLSERFYRVDASRSRAQGGAGLGLALCRRILETHGATLAFAHSPLGGLRVTASFARESA